MLVSDVMTTTVISVTPDTTLGEAMRLMRENKIRRLPVTDGHGHIIGIVTEKDILSASPSKASALDVWEIYSVFDRVTVEEIMTRDVLTVNENTPIEDAAKIMAEKKIGALPVLNEEGHLVGIVTESDIFRVFVKMLGADREGVRYTFLAPDKPGIVYELAKRIKDAGGNIIAISSYPKDGEEYLIVIKVFGIDHEGFVANLEGCDVVLLHSSK